jgi:glutamate N-acetyltransferase/amino-acid N-acetyltransferase
MTASAPRGTLVPLLPLPSDLPEAAPVARLPRGFRAAGVRAGIKSSGGPDLALVVVDGEPAAVAATFTTNRLPAAPVLMNREHLAATDPAGHGRRGWVSAIMSTSGCANAATGEVGLADQRTLAQRLATAIEVAPAQVLGLSTGLIGTRLPVERIGVAMEGAIPGELRADDAALDAVAQALRTTDSRAKAAALSVSLPGPDDRPVVATVSGVAKGVGMIHPNMATMLCLVLTDASASPEMLEHVLRPAVARTWDQLSVDGDQSTNDTVLLVASGASGSALLTPGSDAATSFARAVEAVARSLARQQAADGEGATSLISCQVSGALDDVDARAVARAVVSSDLVKAAVHGADPNWGRIAGAAGNAVVASAEVLEAAGLGPDEARRRAGRSVELDPARLRIDLEGVPVYAGQPVDYLADEISARMRRGEVHIRIDLGLGPGAGEAFGCDLTEAYVVENSAYST